MATDYSKLSDEELKKLAGIPTDTKKVEKPTAPEPAPKPDVSKMSDAELMAVAGVKPSVAKSLLEKAGEKIVEVGRTLDSYTGAPTRAAVGSLLQGEGLLGAVRRGYSQIGQDPSRPLNANDPRGPRAPTGEELVDMSGAKLSSVGPMLRIPVNTSDLALPPGVKVRDEDKYVSIELPSARTVAGTVAEVALDPTNVLPVGKVLSAAGKGVGLAADAVKAGGRAAIEAAKEIPAVKAVGNVIEGSKAALNKISNPTIAKDFDEFVQIAEKNGIDPSL